MNINDFFETIGGNYKEALSRFSSDDIIMIFIKKYMNDSTFTTLVKAVENHDIKTAFEAAHTLKGVSGNLCFDRLFTASSALTEQLRSQTMEADMELYSAVCKEQETVIAAINALK